MDLGRAEALGVAHCRPHVRLDVGERLANVVAIMMDPFLEQVPDAEGANPIMGAAARQLTRLQVADQRDRSLPQLDELAQDIGAWPLAVLAIARHAT